MIFESEETILIPLFNNSRAVQVQINVFYLLTRLAQKAHTMQKNVYINTENCAQMVLASSSSGKESSLSSIISIL